MAQLQTNATSAVVAPAGASIAWQPCLWNSATARAACLVMVPYIVEEELILMQLTNQPCCNNLSCVVLCCAAFPAGGTLGAHQV